MTSQQLLAILAGAGRTPQLVILSYASERSYREAVELLVQLDADLVIGRTDVAGRAQLDGAYEKVIVRSGDEYGTEYLHLLGPRDVFTHGPQPIDQLASERVSLTPAGLRLVRGGSDSTIAPVTGGDAA